MPKTFELQSWSHPVPVTVSDSLPIDIDEAVLLDFPAFRNWLSGLQENLRRQADPAHTYHTDPFRLHGLRILSVSMCGCKPGFMNIGALLRKKEAPKELDRVVFLRGGSVAVLMILMPNDARHERYVIMTEQPRVGACSTMFSELPSGTLDDSDEVKGTTLQVIRGETHLTILKEELIDLTALATQDAENTETLQSGVYSSPAHLDEFVPLLLWEKVLDRQRLDDLKCRLAGRRAENGMATIRIVDYKDLWRKGARDAKTLAAWALYEGLSGTKELEDKRREIRTGKRTPRRVDAAR